MHHDTVNGVSWCGQVTRGKVIPQDEIENAPAGDEDKPKWIGQIGRRIIADITYSQDITPYAELTPAWLHSKKHGAAAVFEGVDLRAYDYILGHLAKHGQVPTETQLRESYPEKVLPLPDADELETPAELREAAYREARRLIVAEGTVDAVDLHDEDRVDEAADRLREAVRRLDAGLTDSDDGRELTMDELDKLPEPEELVENLIDKGKVTIISGPKANGKSFLALDLGLSVATGTEWLDRKVMQGRVLYLAAEGAHGQVRRKKAWCQEHGMSNRDLGLISMRIDPVNLMDSAEVDKLVARVRQGRHALLIIDTLDKCKLGAEENSAKDMGLVLASLYRLRDAYEECGTTVVAIHHTGYGTNKRSRGNSSIEQGVDSTFSMAAPGEEGDPAELIELVSTKRKDGPPIEPMSLALRQVHLREGGTSCVLVETDGPHPDPDHDDRLQIRHVLRDAGAEGLTTPAINKAIPAIKRSTLQRRLEQMEGDGEVAKVTGTGTRGSRWVLQNA